MQTTGFAYGHIHDLCINTVQSVADTFSWGLGYGKLKSEDLQLLQSGAFGNLSWAWALRTYGVPDNQDVVDLSMRILGLDTTFPGGAALCRIDKKRRRLEICMVENFLRDQDTPLTKRVWLSTLVFAHTLAKATKHDEISVMNPVTQYLPLYRKFGFYEDATCPPNLSASLEEIEEAIRRTMSGML